MVRIAVASLRTGPEELLHRASLNVLMQERIVFEVSYKKAWKIDHHEVLRRRGPLRFEQLIPFHSEQLDRHPGSLWNRVRLDLDISCRESDQRIELARRLEHAVAQLLRQAVEHDEFGAHQAVGFRMSVPLDWPDTGRELLLEPVERRLRDRVNELLLIRLDHLLGESGRSIGGYGPILRKCSREARQCIDPTVKAARRSSVRLAHRTSPSVLSDE